MESINNTVDSVDENELNRVDFWTQWVNTHSVEDVAQMMAAKEAEAETDTLTGVLNRRGWNRQVETLSSLCDREEKPLSVLYIDVDKFKKINDDWGHDVGDQVLVFIAGSLKDSCRKSDVVARLGGDEFALLLPFTDKLGSEEIRARVTGIMERSLQEMDTEDPLVQANLSLSVGIGTREVGEKGVDGMMNRADQNMYLVKRSVKNV